MPFSTTVQRDCGVRPVPIAGVGGASESCEEVTPVRCVSALGPWVLPRRRLGFGPGIFVVGHSILAAADYCSRAANVLRIDSVPALAARGNGT